MRSEAARPAGAGAAHTSLEEVALQICRVQLAARLGGANGFAGHDAGTAQAIESIGRAGATAQDFARRVAQRRVAREQDEDAAEVITERAAFPVHRNTT